MSAAGLPDGLLVAWYGDDFTGSAAVAEAMTFAGLPAVLFFDVPTPERLARFAGYRGIGIAGIARSKSTDWMREALPPIFEALRGLRAPVTQYKVCSTFDSAPEVGSIGAAIDVGGPIFGGDWVPLVVAAPAIRRYQAFGNLFTRIGGTAHRLDRDPTMSRHPVTPMHEADVRLHLAGQTARPTGLVDLVAMKSGTADAALTAERERGAQIIALDVVDEETLGEVGRLVWENRGPSLFAVGSQGLEYALIAHWRRHGLVQAQDACACAGPAEHLAVVSGSCSPVTARQIDWAEAHGFRPIRVDAALAVDERAWSGEIDRAATAALGILDSGADPILYTAKGPDDPALAAFGAALEASRRPAEDVSQRVGEGLGRILDRILRDGRLRRGVIAGGDTSGHGALVLGIYALTALAPTVPGAALFRAHSDHLAHDGLEIALKGGQMGTEDYFGRIRAGGGSS